MYLVYGDYDHIDKAFSIYSNRYKIALSLFRESPLITSFDIVKAEPADLKDYRKAHTSTYVDLLERIDKTGVSAPMVPASAVAFERVGVGGTMKAVQLALENKTIAYHLGGGYHHGMPDGPNSIDYCNDVAIGLASILERGVKRILYVDLDAHHPDGVQCVFLEDPRVFQLSLHCWTGSDPGAYYDFIGSGKAKGFKVNMPLPSHTGDQIYLDILQSTLKSILLKFTPEVVFYQAGVDPYQRDPIGNLNLSLRGLYERDVLVRSSCSSTPLVVVLGGGYSVDGAPKAVINTLAALADKPIVYDEPYSRGACNRKTVLKWHQKLTGILAPYITLGSLDSEEARNAQA